MKRKCKLAPCYLRLIRTDVFTHTNPYSSPRISLTYTTLILSSPPRLLAMSTRVFGDGLRVVGLHSYYSRDFRVTHKIPQSVRAQQQPVPRPQLVPVNVDLSLS